MNHDEIPEYVPPAPEVQPEFEHETTIIHRERAQFRMIVETTRLACTRTARLSDESKHGVTVVCDILSAEIDALG